MAADVRSLVRILSQYKEEGEALGNGDLITRDLLGGRPLLGSADELDLDLHVPSGWENRLDLSSGKVNFHRRSNGDVVSSSGAAPVLRHLQDLNLPPLSSAIQSPYLPNLLEDPTLDLKLVSSSTAAAAAAADHRSVCTLEKVKSALERAEWESQRKQRIRQSDDSPSPTSSSATASPIKRSSGNAAEQEEVVGESRTLEGDSGGEACSLIAAGCPSCLLYVLISKRNPKCPHCESEVPVLVIKKPRIDLNSTCNPSERNY